MSICIMVSSVTFVGHLLTVILASSIVTHVTFLWLDLRYMKMCGSLHSPVTALFIVVCERNTRRKCACIILSLM